MPGWFRMYAEVLNDPKVQLLPPEDFKLWVNLMCMTREFNGMTGVIPDIPDIAFSLRMGAFDAQAAVARLVRAGLIDMTDEGMVIHNWKGRQFKSDSSTERVKRFRQRFKVVT